MGVPKIVGIYVVRNYQGLFKIQLCKEYVKRIVNNASEFKFPRNFAFACFPSLSPGVITWLEPQSNKKTHCLVSGQLKKTRDLNELLTWACDMVMWYWSVDTLLWQLSFNYNMDLWQWCYSLIFQGMGPGVRTYECTDSHMTTKIFEIDGLPNFLRYRVWGSAHVPSAHRSSVIMQEKIKAWREKCTCKCRVHYSDFRTTLKCVRVNRTQTID